MNIAIQTVKHPLIRRYLILARGLVQARNVQDFALRFLPVLAKAGLALPAAWLVHRTIRPLTSRPARYRVLVIEKAVFNEDIMEVLGGASDFQVFGVGRAVIKSLALGILPRMICDDAAYMSDDAATGQAKLRYRRLWAALWRYLMRLRSYDAVLTGNWCYWAEREMASALESYGTPFIVLHKEGIKPPERSQMLRDLFRKTRGQFTGRRVLVYHEDERDHQVEGEISHADQIRVVGMPRLDRVHKWRVAAASGLTPARAGRPTVLFLAFIENNFLPSYSGIDSDLAWTELSAGSYRAMVALAAENPDINVIVRPRLQEVAEVESLLSRGGTRPNNLRVVPDGEVMPLIEASWVICGHNTTVLLEGLAAGKPVVVPHFGESLDTRYQGYNVELGDAVEHARSVDDLIGRVRAHCISAAPIPAELSNTAHRALAIWTGNPDGRSAERVREVIMDELTAAGR